MKLIGGLNCQCRLSSVLHTALGVSTVKSLPPAKVPNISVPKPLEPWTKVRIDIAGPFAGAPVHQQYIVTIIDYTTDFPECLLMTLITSATIIK